MTVVIAFSKRRRRQYVGRTDPVGHQPDDGFTGAPAVFGLRCRDRLLGGAARQAQPQRFDRRCHRVRRVHAAAGAGSRNGRRLDVSQLTVADGTCRVTSDGLEDRNDVAMFRPRLDRAAVNEHGGPVEPSHRHRARRHVLVAAADRDVAVEALRRHDRLDRIGDDFARHERIAHAGRAHRNAVGHADRVELDGLAAGRIGTVARRIGQLVDVHVARCDHAPGRRDADLRFGKVRIAEADGTQHRTARRLRDTVDDDSRVSALVRHLFQLP